MSFKKNKRKKANQWINKFKTVSKGEIIKANTKRKKFFDFFNKNNVKYACDNLSKPYINKLSPGCSTCINGTWSCLFINELCTRNCFFCAQDRKIKKESLPKANHFRFEKVEEYINYLKKFNFKGIGFSGGEPFLVFDRLVEYIKKIRQVFGSEHYLWIYTNGDLVTEEKLKLLAKLGLNEIRFDLSARDYDLKPVKLAVKHIKTVTIEIPAIPEDLEKVKSLLKKFEKIGVKFLNIHQLFITNFSYPEFIKREYTFLRAPSPRLLVLESEFAAFKLLEYAIKNNLKIGINYCSYFYKIRFQNSNAKKRIANRFKEKKDLITKSGYLRNIKHISDSNKKIIYFDYICKLKNKIHSSLKDYKKEDFKRVKVNSVNLNNKTLVILFKKLFLENKSFKKTADELAELYNLDNIDKKDLLKDIEEFYNNFESLEYLPIGFPEYY